MQCAFQEISSRASQKRFILLGTQLPSEAYYLSLACHNAALLNVKLGRWADAQELVDEGIEFTKARTSFRGPC